MTRRRTWKTHGLRVIVDVVRETPVTTGAPLNSAEDVAGLVRDLQGRAVLPSEREAFVAIYLDSRHRVIGWHLVSIGGLNSCQVSPREVFRPAVALGAHAVVCAHNHPSGDCNPSTDDRRITQRLQMAGAALGIELLDHVVVTSTGYAFASAT